MNKSRIRESGSHWIVAFLLMAGTFAIFAGALRGHFLMNWDDSYYVVENSAIRGFTLEHIREAFTKFYVGNYAPLQIVSYMFDYTLWGLNPAGYLFANILIHALNGILFYWLLFKLSGRQACGFIAAFIFLFHPVQVESVAWISQRKNVLAMLFFLIALLGYISYRQDPAGRRRTQWYMLSCIMYLLALLSKSVVVIMPLVILLFDLCFLEKGARKGWLANKLPYVLLTAVIVVITLESQASIITEGEALFKTSSPLGMFYTMLTVLTRYFALLFWPTHLSALYMLPLKFGIDSAVAWSAVLLLFLLVFGAILYRRGRDLFFWYALFFIALIPVFQIVKIVTLMNDRYLYFPMLGAAAFFAGVANPLITGKKPAQTVLATATLCLMLLPLPWLSLQRAAVWHDDLTLWTDVVLKTPESSQAWLGLGMSNYDAGRKNEALRAYSQALSIDPNYQFALNNIGGLYNEMKKPEEGRQYLTRLVQLFPDYFEGYVNLGRNYYMTGELEKAEITFKKALELRPGTPLILTSLGDIYLDMKRLDMADKYYHQAINNGGSNAYIEYKLSCIKAQAGHQHR